MSLTLNIYDDKDDYSENKTRFHIGDYILDENINSSWNNLKISVLKKIGSDYEKISSNIKGNLFISEYSKKTGDLKLLIAETPYLFVKTNGLYLFKDTMKEVCGYWDVLRNEYLIGIKGLKKSLFVLDIFFQNEFEFDLNKLECFKDVIFTDIIFTFQWNKYKNRIDFFITNKINYQLVKIILDIKKQKWIIKDEVAICLNRIIDMYLFNDNLTLFTEKGVYDCHLNDWIFTFQTDYKLTKVYKTVNSNQIWLEAQYKNNYFPLKQIYLYNIIGNFYNKIEFNIDFFHFKPIYFRHQWVCRLESPISQPIWINELDRKKTFFIPTGSSNEYEEKKDYIEFKRKKMKYILFKKKILASSVFIFLSSSHLKNINYKDELFENKDANRKMIYPTYIFTKPEWILKIVEHFRQMLNLHPKQILIDWTLNEDIPLKLSETIDFFFTNNNSGEILYFNNYLQKFEKKNDMVDKKYNNLLDVFI